MIRSQSFALEIEDSRVETVKVFCVPSIRHNRSIEWQKEGREERTARGTSDEFETRSGDFDEDKGQCLDRCDKESELEKGGKEHALPFSDQRGLI